MIMAIIGSLDLEPGAAAGEQVLTSINVYSRIGSTAILKW